MRKLKVKKIKLKSHRGAAKRFIETGSGEFKHGRASRRHILTKKSTKLKRHLRGSDRYVCDADHNSVKRMLRGS